MEQMRVQRFKNEDPSRWRRRLATIPMALLIPLLVLPAFPLLLPFACIADLAVKRWTVARALCFFSIYLLLQPVGLTGACAIWAERIVRRDQGTFIRRNNKLQKWWAGCIVGSLSSIFKLDMRVDGEVPDCRGKIILVRHASAADAPLPMLVLVIPQGLEARYVLKEELRWDPCLDIVGHRLPNAFVRRGAGQKEIQRIAALGQDLGEDSCVILYPEGTRFSQKKRDKRIRRLQEKGMAGLAWEAENLNHCMLPHTGGALELINEARAEDVVFMVHTGFENVSGMDDLFNGCLMEKEIGLRFWKAKTPAQGEEGDQWLFSQWKEMDRWLALQAGCSPCSSSG
jgi:1-acyl-sn-glycerol-3-phosphate acyltransferase